MHNKNQKKDILFLCQYFYPENISSATLPFDTAEYFASNGFKVGCLCGYPKEFIKTKKAIPKNEIVQNVNIKRIKYLQLGRKSKLGRIINYFSFTLSVLFHMHIFKKYKSVVVYSNPPILPIAAILANMLFKTKIIFVSYDVYPEIAYASNSIRKNSFIDKFMKLINKKLYSRVSAVVTLTDEMKNFLIEHRPQLNSHRIYVIPNWAHERERISVEQSIYQKLSFKENQFIVSYFGNMGTCQDIKTLLDTAKLLKNNSKIGFLLVGHGNKMEMAQDFVLENNLDNVKIFNYLTGDTFKQAVAASKCAVVSLEKGIRGTCAPSKYYSYLLGGLPVIGIVEKQSYLSLEIQAENIGFSVENGESIRLAEYLVLLSNDEILLSKMSKNSALLYEKKYCVSKIMNLYLNMVRNVLENHE